jgi:serine protease Do
MTLLADFSQELETLVETTAPSVVAVEHGRGQGSGIVIAGDGFVVTNSHVVHEAQGELIVRHAAGESLRAEVIGNDPQTDLAVLRVAARGLSSLALRESRLRVGQLVVAIGNPLRFERSVSLGVVSAIDRTLPGPRGRPFEGLVQTDAAINPGNSGGPLLDAEGAVVGINTAVIPWARGLGFAVPAHTVAWVTAMLMKKGHIARPLIGVAATGVELPLLLARDLAQPRAIRVHDVSRASPAERAGLKAGDLLLDANRVTLHSVDDLQRALVLGEGSSILLSVQRGAERRAIEVTPEPARKAA